MASEPDWRRELIRLSKIADAAEALIRHACEKPYPPSDLLWGDLAAALWGDDDPRTLEYREGP